MRYTIKDYLSLSITDLRRFGYFEPNTTKTGVIEWRSNGKKIGCISFCSDTRGVPLAFFSFVCDGVPKQQTLRVMFKHSNLTPETPHGYYYFVCPVTGNLCRKLYLVNGEFVSRSAFRPLYEQQTQSKHRRADIFKYLDLLEKCEQLEKQRYRRETYKGKLTPYGRRLERLITKLDAVADGVSKDFASGWENTK